MPFYFSLTLFFVVSDLCVLILLKNKQKKEKEEQEETEQYGSCFRFGKPATVVAAGLIVWAGNR